MVPYMFCVQLPLNVMANRELTAEQATRLTLREYEQLKTTYASLIKSVSLTDNNHIALESLEGGNYILHVTADGWKVVEGEMQNDRQRTWEMVEDLLRSVSPAFKQGWDELLLAKLNTLADCRGSEDTQDDNG